MHNETFTTTKDINDIKIALLSDIHYYPNFNLKIFTKLINQIKENNPNYICITGDLLDDSACNNIIELVNFIKELSLLNPTFIIYGNHDEKTGKIGKWNYHKNQELYTSLKSINNVHLLEDTIWTDQNTKITLYGFNLSYKHYEEDLESYESFCKEIDKLNCLLPIDTYNITLCHSPINIYKYIEKNPNSKLNMTDLIFSGHMHNGCLPFIISYPINKLLKTNRGILTPQKKFGGDYCYGRMYKIKDGYIHQGITKIGKSIKLLHIFDFLFSKKIEFITIKKQV